MKKFILFLFVFLAFALKSQSQIDPGVGNPQPVKKKACFEIASLSIALGGNNYKTMEHKEKGNDSEMSLKDQNDQNNGRFGKMGNMMGQNSGNFSIRKHLDLEIGFNPYCKKLGDYNKKRELSIGLYYSSFNIVDKNSMEFTTTPGDTFSNNLVKYQTDTIGRTQRTYREEADVLGAKVQYLYKTDPEKRLSLFTGYGISAGYAINSQIYDRYTKDSAVVVDFYNTKPNINEFDNGNFLGSTEEKMNKKPKAMIFTSVFIPFGVNFRLSKTKEIWDQMNLFMNGNVGLEAQITVDSKTHFNPFVGCNMGFKFDFN